MEPQAASLEGIHEFIRYRKATTRSLSPFTSNNSLGHQLYTTVATL